MPHGSLKLILGLEVDITVNKVNTKCSTFILNTHGTGLPPCYLVTSPGDLAPPQTEKFRRSVQILTIARKTSMKTTKCEDIIFKYSHRRIILTFFIPNKRSL